MDGYLPVRVLVPLDQYRLLYAEAESKGVTVADLILHRSRTTRAVSNRTGRQGRPSNYTPRSGEEAVADRRLGKSWAEIGRGLGVNHATAKAWANKYLAEVRAENKRYGAERRTA